MSTYRNNKNIVPICSRLSERDRIILVGRAAQFDINAIIDGDKMELVIEAQKLDIILPIETGLNRLVAELSSVLAPWLSFSKVTRPEVVLLRLKDLKYQRLVAAWRLSGAVITVQLMVVVAVLVAEASDYA
jgi:hypothetical protein